MANDKPIQPPVAAIDPKAMMAFSFLSSPDGQEYMRKQNELLDIQLDAARTAREQKESAQATAIASRKKMADIARASEQAEANKQSNCNHMHQNGDHALRGQRMAAGSGIPALDAKRKTWIARCQLCGKAYDNTTGLPNGWTIQAEHFGGPNF